MQGSDFVQIRIVVKNPCRCAFLYFGPIMGLKAGVGKAKVVFRQMSMPLFGYGRFYHLSTAQETDLFARAFLFQHDNQYACIINLECYMISHHFKKAVLDEIAKRIPKCPIKAEHLLICTQNTHSAPGGISHYAFHNLSTRGFRPDVFEAYKNACVESFLLAWNAQFEAHLFLNASEIEASVDVGFNRSLDAYNRNVNVEPLDDTQTHLAIDRMMRQVRITDTQGHERGLINWFGVQGTSISVNNDKIHSDNKGYAASLLENDKSELHAYVAGFCNDASADVSPNYHGRAKWWPRGKFEDEFKSAYFTGFLQFEKAKSLTEKEDEQIPISNRVECRLQYFDFSSVLCDADFSDDGLEHRTGNAAAGLAMLSGSPVDNPGVDAITYSVLQSWVRYRNFLRKVPLLSKRQSIRDFKNLSEAQGNKLILSELQERKVLGFSNLTKLKLPPGLSEVGDELKHLYRKGALNEHTWVPVIIPIQIILIGELAIAAVPGEITTVAGRRLKEALLNDLQKQGVLDVVLCCNANEYMGYTTTKEEYEETTYERGMTFFGHYTLAALQTCFRRVSTLFESAPDIKSTGIQPPEFSPHELNLRTAHKNQLL